MSNCLLEHDDIVRVARAHLFNRLHQLKDMTCCGEAPGAPGVDLHVVNYELEERQRTHPQTGKLLGTDYILTVVRSDGQRFTQTVAVSPPPSDDVHVVGMDVAPVMVGGSTTAHKVTVRQNNGSSFSVDIPHAVVPDFDAAYRLVDQAEDYTLLDADFDGRTIIRATKDGDQIIKIPRPPEAFKGKSVIVRKVAGGVDTTLLLQEEGSTLSPPDATMLRRVGSTVTLMYTGDGNWDIYGELP